MKFQLYVIFHKYIFDECYEGISQDFLDKYITFVAVNPKYEKIYTPGKYKVINEWELPIYDKSLQENSYRENSAIYHLYENKVCQEYDYVGFFQYDMKLTNELILFLIEHLNDIPTIYYHFPTDFNWMLQTSRYDLIESVVKSYETFFNVYSERNRTYYLFNTYVIPYTTYAKMGELLKYSFVPIYNELIQYYSKEELESKWLASTFERLMAIGLGEENINKVPLPNISHDHTFKAKSY